MMPSDLSILIEKIRALPLEALAEVEYLVDTLAARMSPPPSLEDRIQEEVEAARADRQARVLGDDAVAAP